jgi:hypothetical protein
MDVFRRCDRRIDALLRKDRSVGSASAQGAKARDERNRADGERNGPTIHAFGFGAVEKTLSEMRVESRFYETATARL